MIPTLDHIDGESSPTKQHQWGWYHCAEHQSHKEQTILEQREEPTDKIETTEFLQPPFHQPKG